MPKKTSKTLLLIFSISAIISLFVFAYLFIKHPLTQYTYLDWLGDPTISDYGQIEETKNILNTTFIIYGIINILNILVILQILKTKNYLKIFLLIASIGIIGVGLIPIPIYNDQPIRNAIHWSLGGLAVLVQPILISMIIPKKKIRTMFGLTLILALIASAIWYILKDNQKLFGEILLGGVTVFGILLTNILCIQILKTEKK